MKLKFDINALAAIEDLTGEGVLNIVTKLEAVIENPHLPIFSILKKLFWAGSLAEFPNLKLYEAGEKMQQAIAEHEKGLEGVSVAISEAIFACGLFNKQKAKTEGAENPNTESGTEDPNPPTA